MLAHLMRLVIRTIRCGASTCCMAHDQWCAIRTGDVDASTLVHLSGVADLNVADRASPNGVRPPLPGRRSDRAPILFHTWLNPDGLPVRMSIEQTLGYPSRDRMWTATEFTEFGVNVEELWSSTVRSRTSR